MTQQSERRSQARVFGMGLGIVGAVLTLVSLVMGIAAVGAAATIVWIAPETAGLVLLVIGLHAWIDR